MWEKLNLCNVLHTQHPYRRIMFVSMIHLKYKRIVQSVLLCVSIESRRGVLFIVIRFLCCALIFGVGSFFSSLPKVNLPFAEMEECIWKGYVCKMSISFVRMRNKSDNGFDFSKSCRSALLFWRSAINYRQKRMDQRKKQKKLMVCMYGFVD